MPENSRRRGSLVGGSERFGAVLIAASLLVTGLVVSAALQSFLLRQQDHHRKADW